MYTFECDNVSEIRSKELIISGEHLTSIDTKVFEKLTNLEILKIRNTLIEDIPEGIQNLLNLKEFDFSNNKLSLGSLDLSKLKDLKNLTKLTLTKNNLSNFELSLENLKYLDISYNKIRELSTKIGNLKNLVSLNISNNELKKLPQSIGELKKLEMLNLGYNRLSKLCFGVVRLNKLTKLFLYHNKFTAIPIEISLLTKLKTLRLEYNQILSIKQTQYAIDTFKAFYNHKRREYQLKSNLAFLKNDCGCFDIFLPVNAGYYSASSLTKLDLSNNKITDVSRKILDFKKLNFCFLAGNKITKMPEFISKFKNRKNLLIFDVSGNPFVDRNCRDNWGINRLTYRNISN